MMMTRFSPNSKNMNSPYVMISKDVNLSTLLFWLELFGLDLLPSVVETVCNIGMYFLLTGVRSWIGMLGTGWSGGCMPTISLCWLGGWINP